MRDHPCCGCNRHCRYRCCRCQCKTFPRGTKQTEWRESVVFAFRCSTVKCSSRKHCYWPLNRFPLNLQFLLALGIQAAQHKDMRKTLLVTSKIVALRAEQKVPVSTVISSIFWPFVMLWPLFQSFSSVLREILCLHAISEPQQNRGKSSKMSLYKPQQNERVCRWQLKYCYAHVTKNNQIVLLPLGKYLHLRIPLRDSKEVGSHAIFEVHRNVKSKVDVLVIQRSRNGTSDTLMYIMLCMEWHVTGSLGGYFFFGWYWSSKKMWLPKRCMKLGPIDQVSRKQSL